MTPTPPQYPTGEEVHAGDSILFGGSPAFIMFVTQRNEYADGFPRDDWAFVEGDTIAVRFEDGNIMMYDSFCDQDAITLLRRAGTY